MLGVIAAIFLCRKLAALDGTDDLHLRGKRRSWSPRTCRRIDAEDRRSLASEPCTGQDLNSLTWAGD